MNAKEQVVHGWIRKAESDLRTIDDEEFLPGREVAQQAVQTALRIRKEVRKRLPDKFLNRK